VTGDPKIDEILARNRKRDAGARHAKDSDKDKDSDREKERDKDKSEVTRSIASDILEEIQSETDFKLFASTLLRSNDGARELGSFVRHYPGRSMLSALVQLVATTPPAKVALVLGEAMRDDDPRSATLLVAAVARICGAGQPRDARIDVAVRARSRREERGRA
jgi:hypothetical protein